MLYVATTNKEHIPLGWEEAEYLYKKLQVLCIGMGFNYQYVWERRMLSDSTYSEIRAKIIKWDSIGVGLGVGKPKRLVMAEAYSCAELVPVLLMLIAVTTDERNARGLPEARVMKWD